MDSTITDAVDVAFEKINETWIVAIHCLDMRDV